MATRSRSLNASMKRIVSSFGVGMPASSRPSRATRASVGIRLTVAAERYPRQDRMLRAQPAITGSGRSGMTGSPGIDVHLVVSPDDRDGDRTSETESGTRLRPRSRFRVRLLLDVDGRWREPAQP